jgi:simple sugar transport system ATP-binding protein
MGVRKPHGGQVFIDGQDQAGLSPQQIARAGLVHIPEDRIEEGLVPDFTVEENLILGRQEEERFARRSFLRFRNIRSFAEDCIRSFEISTPSAQQKTKNLSGGNLQKVILARELTQQPRCILANQPTRGLDVGATEYVHRRLLEQRLRGAGILLISEDLDELFNLSDRLAVMYRGEIVGLFEANQADLQQVGLLMAGVRGGA